jgi:L-ribulose-5-phosphate 3-epimerase
MTGINRRRLGRAAVAGLAGVLVGGVEGVVGAGEFTGKIRKSLKWSMVKEGEKLGLRESFRRLKACGYDGVEPGMVHVKDAAEWRAAADAEGLVVDAVVGVRADTLEEGLDLTAALGGDSMLVVLSYESGLGLQVQWDRAVMRLKEAAGHAEKKGIPILIENVWNTFLISAFDMARFIDEVGSEWVQVHFDVGNMVRWGVPEHWAEVLGSRSKKLDVKEYDLKIAMNEGMRKGFNVPLGEGSINWAAVREELAKISYQGWAAAEVAAGDWEYLADVSRRMDLILDL